MLRVAEFCAVLLLGLAMMLTVARHALYSDIGASNGQWQGIRQWQYNHTLRKICAPAVSAPHATPPPLPQPARIPQ